MPCHHLFSAPCPENTHQLQWKCPRGAPEKCASCEKEKQRQEKQARLDLEAQEQREAAKRLHELDMMELEAQLQFEKEKAADIQAAKDWEKEKRQKVKEIEDARKQVKNVAKQAAVTGSSTVSTGPGNVNSIPPRSTHSTSNQSQDGGNNIPAHPQNSTSAPLRPSVSSPARDKWEYQKHIEGIQNNAIDNIMDLTGLEEVKEQILRIKAKIDMMKRQGVALDKERLNLVLLGNPGTGQLYSPCRSITNGPLNQEKQLLRDCMRNFWNPFKCCPATRSWRPLGPSYPTKESEVHRI